MGNTGLFPHREAGASSGARFYGASPGLSPGRSSHSGRMLSWSSLLPHSGAGFSSKSPASLQGYSEDCRTAWESFEYLPAQPLRGGTVRWGEREGLSALRAG